MDDQPLYYADDYNSEPMYKRNGSIPSVSTGMFLGSNVQNKLAAANRIKAQEVNKFI